MENIIQSLYDIGAIKFGSFNLKSGISSPIYFDFRVIVSYPKIMSVLSELVFEEMDSLNMRKDFICGVPYTALPIATVVSIKHGIPMVLKRKEEKEYGTKKIIEGVFKEGATCVVIEDVVTSGSSVLETVQCLKENGLKVTTAIALLDRGQGGKSLLLQNGVELLSVLTISDILSCLTSKNCLTPKKKAEVEKFIEENQFKESDPKPSSTFPVNPIVEKLLDIIREKESNLCVSADFQESTKILQLAEAIGDKICILKTHIDSISFESEGEISEYIQELTKLSKKHNFMLMEDRKFADIGATVYKQLTAKPFEIAKWADIVTVHGIPGPGIFEAFNKLENPIGVIVIGDMSSKRNIPSSVPEYKNHIIKMCSDKAKLVVGLVSQTKNFTNFLQFTPGVSLSSDLKGDGLGQQYRSIEEVVVQGGADIIIVGRGITQKPEWEWDAVTNVYQKRAWSSHQVVTNKNPQETSEFNISII